MMRKVGVWSFFIVETSENIHNSNNYSSQSHRIDY